MEEVLGFSFSGEGEHLCLHIEKRGENTRWIAKLLAEHFEVDEVAIGYCGLKDRRAVARQWFSVHLPNKFDLKASDLKVSDVKVPDGQVTQAGESDGAGYKVLEVARHHQKLRRGMHQANSFVIRLRDIQGKGDSELIREPIRDSIEPRLQKISAQGVPNYFGEQRFGIDGGNLVEADALLRAQYGADRQPDQEKKSSGKKRGRKHRGRKRGSPRGGMYLSAARSYLFNLVLAEYVSQGSWLELIEGQTASGPMWGRGRSNAPETVREFEQPILSDWQDWTNALEFNGLQQERRDLVLHPEDLSWRWLVSDSDKADSIGDDLELSFTLPSGAFATSVLREVAQLSKVL